MYKNFPLVVSDRWQNEIAETVFEVVNQEADKIESKRRHRPRADEPDEIGMVVHHPPVCWVLTPYRLLGGNAPRFIYAVISALYIICLFT